MKRNQTFYDKGEEKKGRMIKTSGEKKEWGII